ncbi:MAG: pyridoxal phosphate-dependent aminotransferase [Candidatus Heimdallarchaeaceae archaeon]
MNPLASRLSNFQESVIREMTRKAIEHNAVNLSQGMPDYAPPSILLEGVDNALKENEHQYSVTYGRKDLREKISDKLENYNDILYDSESEITVTCGASEAIASSMLAILNPSDEVLVLEPHYENYVPLTYLSGAKPRFVKLGQNDFKLDEEAFKESINDKTKAIFINTPHNPTGKVFSKDELLFLSDLCNDNDLIAVTDEIYEYIIYDGLKHISPASIDEMFDKTITISGFSKTFSITGWRLGYVAAEKQLMNGIRKVHDYLTICAPSLLQTAVLKSFDLGEEYYTKLKERYQTNRDYLFDNLSRLGMYPINPKGAYYLLANVSEFSDSDIEFADFLVRDQGVATVPGSSFYQKDNPGSDAQKYVRFSFSHKLETLQEAVSRIEQKLKEK